MVEQGILSQFLVQLHQRASEMSEKARW